MIGMSAPTSATGALPSYPAWLVLDVDDTLVDTYRTGLAKMRTAAEQLGLASPDDATFAAGYGRWPFRECVRRWWPDADLDRFQNAYDALGTAHPHQPLGQVPALLASARSAGLGVGVLTNGPGHKTATKLNAVGVAASDFDFVCHADNWWPKSRPESFRELSRFGVTPTTCWYVSDSPADWAAAEAAGLSAVGVASAVPYDWHRRAGWTPPRLAVPYVDALVAMTGALVAAAGPAALGPPRAVAFDAGFTLVEDRRTPHELVAKALADQGRPVAAEDVDEAFRQHVHLLADTSIWASDQTIARTLDAFYGGVLARLGATDPTVAATVVADYTRPDSWRRRTTAREVLDWVRQRDIPTGVMSNWQTSLGDMLVATGLDDLVDAVVSSAVTNVAKPDRRAFELAASALGTSVDHLVYVGDDPCNDGGAALAAGCRAVFVPRTAPVAALPATTRLVVP
ncbi:HAD family hydrolase [Micromonospora sp. NPDC048170]|uniref:HAD hydrolase-like protein n=1 Tax=Micromonospora sp. NPDC048170 TaxID=3154819 RepID=UPI0033F0CB9B